MVSFFDSPSILHPFFPLSVNWNCQSASLWWRVSSRKFCRICQWRNKNWCVQFWECILYLHTSCVLPVFACMHAWLSHIWSCFFQEKHSKEYSQPLNSKTNVPQLRVVEQVFPTDEVSEDTVLIPLFPSSYTDESITHLIHLLNHVCKCNCSVVPLNLL